MSDEMPAPVPVPRLHTARLVPAEIEYPRFPEGHPLRPHVTYRLSREA